MVEGETIEHFSHVEMSSTSGIRKGLANLFEHRISIKIDFNERRVGAVDISQIAIRTRIRAAVGHRNQLVIRTTMYA
ncbi:MAG: hypothetical protein DRP08_07250 [Candidatus Aenigmatarchaeota archaeon]|nr:MAG: hypothetical protein DRP08_07250 [Candidatus Aenigmarchaeota archaeon]